MPVFVLGGLIIHEVWQDGIAVRSQGETSEIAELMKSPEFNAARTALQEHFRSTDAAIQKNSGNNRRGIRSPEHLTQSFNVVSQNLSQLETRLNDTAGKFTVSDDAARQKSLVMLAAMVSCLALLAALGILQINRRLILPLDNLRQTINEIEAKGFNISIAEDNKPDEIERAILAIKSFQKSIGEKEDARKSERRARIERMAKHSAVQAEIDATVREAVAGNFSRRVDTSSADGVLLDLSLGMNDLLDVVDRGLSETVAVVSAMAHGDLSKKISGEFSGSFAELKEDTNYMSGQLQAITKQIASASVSVENTIGDIKFGVLDLSRRTETQKASIARTTESTEAMSATIRQNADQAQHANRLSAVARETAAKGGKIVGEAVAAMGRIEDSSKEVTNIVGLIEEIAMQTKLLALNASVEAARAGEAGKGFAVVANEVRSLAQRSAEASNDIKRLIASSDEEVYHGVDLVKKAGTSLADIVRSVDAVADHISEIACAIDEQAADIDQLRGAVLSMDEMTGQNDALVAETRAALDSAQAKVGDLRKAVSFFGTGDQPVDPVNVSEQDEGPGDQVHNKMAS